jgi:hypothetical protein
MSADLTAKASSDFMAILLQVANAYRQQKVERPSTVAVVNALLAAEKTAKQRKLIYPFSSLLGQWRLCFATGTRKARERGGILLGKGFYVPKLALTRISFSTTAQALDVTPVTAEIGNSVQLGSFLLKLTGPAQYLGKKNLLAFNFTQMQIRAFGNTIYSGQIRGGKAQELDFYTQSINKLPFFGFFLVTEDFIAARGRGGGLAIWVREI